MCAAKNTACHDETVVYRIAKPSGESVKVSADRIVDGKTVNMGALDFRYDGDQDALVCVYPQGVWTLKIDSGKMEGTLKRPDGAVFRRVTLTKDR